MLSTTAFWLSIAIGVLSFRGVSDENWSNLFLILAAIGIMLASLTAKLDEVLQSLHEEAVFDFETEPHDDIDLSGIEE